MCIVFLFGNEFLIFRALMSLSMTFVMLQQQAGVKKAENRVILSTNERHLENALNRQIIIVRNYFEKNVWKLLSSYEAHNEF